MLNKNSLVLTLKTKVVTSYINAKERMIRVPGKENEDTMSFTNYLRRLRPDGLVFQSQFCIPRKLLVIKISNLLMKEGSILKDF